MSPRKPKPRRRGKTPPGTHVPVLFDAVMACLRPAPGDVVADCTIGYGGHACGFLERIRPGGRLVGLDVDCRELERTRRRLEDFGPAAYLRNYAEIAGVMAEEGLDGFDIIFADLGVSSMQVDDPARGISYRHPNSPLDMRMDQRLPHTGADLVNSLPEEAISVALRDLADEPDHARIAAFLCQQRQVQPIATTRQLIQTVFGAKGTTENAWRRTASYGEPHPAMKTFQAIRMLVNDELGNLEALLRAAPSCLRPGGRIGIISFHSGEDGRVKNAFRDGRREGVYAATSRGAIRPRAAELRSNPRSSSARFRWAVKPPQ
jgi:16S rRNA (cytosine1402-N4)-methyltransferase